MMDYAQLTLPHDSIGMSPFKLLYGYAPRTSFDWDRPTEPVTARERLSHEEARAFTAKMHGAWETAQTIIKKA
jgi:hypothetical protein